MAVPSLPVRGLDPPRRNWRTQLVAGIVGSLAVVAVPLSLGLLAFAPLGADAARVGLAAAGVATVIGGLVFAALSRSAIPAAGPSSATALILAALVLQLAADAQVFDGSAAGIARLAAGCGAAVALSGLLQVALAEAGLARLSRLVPRPVLGGFMNGVALLILIGQVPLLLGLQAGTALGAGALVAAHPGAVLLGLGTLATLVLFARWRARVPTALAALLLGTAVHALVSARWPGEPLGPAVGTVPALWPDLQVLWPLVQPRTLEALWPHVPAIATTAAVLALIGGLESMLGLLALDEQLGSRHDPRHELRAVGLCNLVAGALGGLPAVVLRARAVATLQAGGRGALAVAAGSVALALLFVAGAPLLARLPLPVLGGIMVMIGVGLVDRWAGDLLARWWRGEHSADLRSGLAVMTAVCLLTLWQGFAAGVALGVLLSMVIFIVRMNRSLLRSDLTAAERPSRRHYPVALEATLQPLRPAIRIWELEGALFFGNADRLLQRAESLSPGVRALVLDLRRVGSIDETGAAALSRLAVLLKRRQTAMLLSGVRPGSAVARALRAFAHALSTHADADRAVEQAEHLLLGEAAERTLVEVPLASCELLRGLDAAQVAAVAARLHRHRLAPDERLFRQGDAADGLYVVVQGSISLIGTDGEATQRFLSVSPGMMLGEAAALDGGRRSADAVADTATTLYRLPVEALHELQRDEPAIAAQLHRNMAVYLSSRLRAVSSAWWASLH